MKRLTTILALFSLASIGFLAAEKTDDLSISDIMKAAHKGGLLKRVQAPDASEKDKKQLLEFYQALAKLDPPQGSKSDWDERTAKIIEAAQSAVEGDPSKLKRAVNCRDCHNYHKP